MDKVIALFVLFVGLSNSLILNQNSCPDVKTDSNFDLKSFVRGTWYVVAKYPNSFENNNTVVAYKGKHLRGNAYKFEIDLPETSPEFMEVDVSLDGDFDSTGNVNFKVSHGSSKDSQNIRAKIPVFDAKNYVIAYSCNSDGKGSIPMEYAYVVVRSKIVDPNTKETLVELIKSSKYMDYDKLIWLNTSTRNRRCRSKKCANV